KEEQPRLRWIVGRYSVIAFAACLAFLVLAVAAALSIDSAMTLGPVAWLTTGILAVGLFVSMWTGREKLAPPALYLVGSGGVGLLLHAIQAEPQRFAMMAGVALALQVAMCGLVVWLWRLLVTERKAIASPFGLASPVIPEGHWTWLLPAQTALGSLAV